MHLGNSVLVAGGLFLLAVSFIGPIRAYGAPVLSKKAGAEGVSVPLMGAEPGKPAATLRVGSFTVGSQRRGFLRIAVLPLLIATDAQIIFNHPDPKALADLVPALQSLARTSAVEMRPLSISMKENPEVQLRANRAETVGNGDWKLTGVTFPGNPSKQLAEVLLHVSGEESGQLVFQKDGATRSVALFDSIPASNNPKTESP